MAFSQPDRFFQVSRRKDDHVIGKRGRLGRLDL